MKKCYDFSKMNSIKNSYATLLKSKGIKDVLIEEQDERTKQIIMSESKIQ